MTAETIPEPLVVPPSEHPITPEMIDEEARLVLGALNRAGFSAYLVGGGVRDLYLGRTPKDFDIGTTARPGQIRRLFPNSRTIGRRFRLVQVYFRNGKIIEVSTLRSLSEHDLDGPEAVLAPNNTYGTLDQDAQRRDLTINGLFYEIENQTIIDYTGGVADLNNGLVRIIGDPVKRINRDPVRMLRVIRHSARSGFSIDPATWQAVRANSPTLRLCPPSRLRDELLKDLYSGVAADWYDLAVRSGLFLELFRPYAGLLDRRLPDHSVCRTRLEAIFRTIDRINNESVQAGFHRQPDFFLLTCVLVPWAALRHRLFERGQNGRELFQLALDLREALNQQIGPELNLKRSTRQEIVTLLAYLPPFFQHNRKNNWPKWLRRKSYFARCRLLYHYLREAVEGIPVDIASSSTRKPESPREKKASRSGTSRHRNRPAFAGSAKGGVFGFRK